MSEDGKCQLVGVFILFILLIFRALIQPYYSLISDCDETFNYWEPLSFLVRNFGKQTWEYSPEYSIRSWAFLLPFYTILKPLNERIKDKEILFYVGRSLLGLTSFVLEWALSREIKSTMSLHVANMWLLFQLFNPGWFHASVELLPSTFAMLTSLGYMKYTLRYLSSGDEGPFVKSIFFVLLGGILGWPFSLVLLVSSTIHFIATHRFIDILRAFFSSALVLFLISSVVISIDSLFYGKFTSVSWNIVVYNVLFANDKSGPNIFGVEPWYYYPLNLLLNFPITALSFSIIGLFQMSIWPISGSLILWLNIFLAQPHKEERFLYPIYGIFSLLAAVGVFNATNFIRCKQLRRLVRFVIFFTTFLQSFARILALVNNYTAPIEVYANLPQTSSQTLVCVGREWYHYPTSLLLPDNYRLGFVSSGFDGLLPGDFMETVSTREAIRTIPLGMNNQNIFDPSKLANVEDCAFYVDTEMPCDNENDVIDPSNSPVWKPYFCKPFVDVKKSKFLGRALQIPNVILENLPPFLTPYVKKYYQAEYLQYCIYERVENVQETILK